MAGARKSARGRGRHGGEEEESAERWLLTYADMITLLMALFMVLFSISSVNISKFKTLQQALKEAFSGQILPGGRALEKTGTTERASHVPNPTSAATIMPFSLEPKTSSLRSAPGGAAAAAQQEQQSFVHLKQEIESYAHQHGLSSYVQAVIEPRGLVIRLLTDKLLFASGKATLAPAAAPLLEKIFEPDQHRPRAPDRSRGKHRQCADSHRGISQQLGAFHRAGEHCRQLPDRPGRHPKPSERDRLRRTAPDRKQRKRRRSRAQQTRGDRAAAALLGPRRRRL